MRPAPVLVLAALVSGCLDLDLDLFSDSPTTPTAPAYLRLAAASPAVGSALSPSGHVSFTFDYGVGSSNPASVHDLQVEIAAPPGASYAILHPCLAGLYAVAGGRAACDVPLAGDWPRAAHPLAFTVMLIEREWGYLGTPHVGRVVATLGPLTYAN